MNKFSWIILSLLAGCFLPIQAGLNARLGKAVESPVYASLISFAVGSVALVVYILATGQQVSWAGLRSAPHHVWLGGVLGAFYVTVVVLAFPKLGPALTFGLIVLGQMVISLVLDHFNVLVMQQQAINIWRIVGVVLIVAGVVIIRKF
ncbi:MAG TPA: DMT family transporter [Ohtaekwangia sp.]|uniref:DMT family transporter n=1 Tax=Ohtaekwangia sp. TaxID=2066019 RepID=UPI002F956223